MVSEHDEASLDSTIETPAPALSSGQLMALTLALLSIAIVQSFIFAILPPLGRSVGFHEVQINTIISLSALVFTISSAYWGRVSDRMGRKPVILIGLLGSTFGTLIFIAAFSIGINGMLVGVPLFMLIIAVRCLASMTMSAANPASIAYAADNSLRVKRTQIIARLSAAGSIGMIIGPVFAGLLVGWGLLAPMYAAAMLTMAAALFIAFKLPAGASHHHYDRALPRQKLHVLDPRIRLYLICSVGVFIGFSGLQQTLGFRLQDSLGLSGTETARHTGFCLMASAVSTFIMQMTVTPRFGATPIYLVRAGVFSLVIGALIIAAVNDFTGILIGMAFMGAGLGMAVPAIASAVSLAVSGTEQGGAAGLVTACPAAGFIAGPILAGLLYKIYPELAAIGAAAVLATVFVFSFTQRVKTR